MDWCCALLRVLFDGVLSLSSGGIVCAWACNCGEFRGVATAATLGGEVARGSGVDVTGARGGNTRGLFCRCGGACGTLPSGVAGGDCGIRSVVGGASICGMRCLRMVSRRLRWSRLVALIWCVMWPLISLANVLAATMTQSEGVTARFVRYLCLWKIVAETRVARMSFIYIFQSQ